MKTACGLALIKNNCPSYHALGMSKTKHCAQLVDVKATKPRGPRELRYV